MPDSHETLPCHTRGNATASFSSDTSAEPNRRCCDGVPTARGILSQTDYCEIKRVERESSLGDPARGMAMNALRCFLGSKFGLAATIIDCLIYRKALKSQRSNLNIRKSLGRCVSSLDDRA